MFGGLQIEMAMLKLLGDWLEDSGWANALVQADIASSGTANSFINASHVTKTRHAHQVTVAMKTARPMILMPCNQILHLLRSGAYNQQILVSTLTTGLRPYHWSFSCCGTLDHYAKVTSNCTWTP
jgi:hypothetical protein